MGLSLIISLSSASAAAALPLRQCLPVSGAVETLPQTLCPIPSGANSTVILEVNNWDTHAMVTYAFQILLQEKLGLDVELVPTSGGQEVYSRVALQVVDINLEIWPEKRHRQSSGSVAPRRPSIVRDKPTSVTREPAACTPLLGIRVSWISTLLTTGNLTQLVTQCWISCHQRILSTNQMSIQLSLVTSRFARLMGSFTHRDVEVTAEAPEHLAISQRHRHADYISEVIRSGILASLRRLWIRWITR